MVGVGSRMIETVLCATDFSETADRALAQARRFARRHEARLVLVHVIEAMPVSPYPILAAPEGDVPIRELVMARMDEIAIPIRESGVNVDLRIEIGLPGPQLVEVAEAEDAGLVVLGTRGLTGIEHLLLGSSADYVVRRCDRPVLAVHPGDRVIGDRIEKILVPTDLSGNAIAAAEAFIRLFGTVEQSHVDFVYADETPPYFAPFRHETLARAGEPDAIRETIETKMQPTVDALHEAGFEVEMHVLDGNPVEVVADFAAENASDLIMLSTHGRGAVANMFLGRTAQRIVQHAKCPVLTVRPESPEEAD